MSDALRLVSEAGPAPQPIIGESAPIRRAVELAHKFAATPLPILLVGATGTGKELFAERIHYLSTRNGQFVDVNCGALPREMVESLLFGHRRGAFTGAVDSRVGYVERASGGTLFLDELAQLPLESQVKFLRVLERGEVLPLGDDHKRRVDLRVVAAVQEDVQERLHNGLLRRDLYRRVAGIVITLPPLVARPEDVLPLARHFAAREGRLLGAGVEHVLTQYAWPENVRELRQAIDRAVCLCENGTLEAATLAEAIELGAPPDARVWRSPQIAKRCPEQRAQLLAVCEANEWQVERIAAALGVHRATVFRRLKQAGLSRRRTV